MIAAASVTEGWGGPSFATAESMAEMWEVVRYFISAYMPFIMIVVALFAVVGVAAMLVGIFTKRSDDDDDEVEYL